MHGCDCEHSDTSRVVEMFEGRVVFDGRRRDVALSAHPQASLAFAWAFQDGKEPRYLAVLNVPPIK